jgi:hypothetical protein
LIKFEDTKNILYNKKDTDKSAAGAYREGEDMELIILAIGAVFAILSGYLYNLYLRRKRIQDILLRRFGTKPEYKEYDFDRIKILWEETRVTGCPGNIDDITWNDLEMDKVFARINGCCSFAGEQYLYRSLRTLCFDRTKREALERKISYMESDREGRTDIQKKLLCIGKRENSYHVSSFLNDLDSFRLDRIWIYYTLQLLLFLAIASSMIFRHIYAYAFLGIIFLVNMNVYALMKNRYETNIDLITALQNVLTISRKLAGNKEPVVSGIFKENLSVIHKLLKPMSFVNGRHQREYSADFMELCGMYVTGAFLFDFVLYNRILSDLKEHLSVIYELLDGVGELELAVSAASFRKSLPLYCVPKICKEGGICYEEMYNPLLDKPVYNDFSLNGHCIITGSNASGKSTFIKAAAINEILAMSIHTCAAKTARVSEAEVYTSMAVRDDLLAGESYFVREIKSLQRIIEVIDQGRFVIAVIDEILRGTNNRERIFASSAILKYLEDKNCMVIVASHDVELIDLLGSERYANYFFCEQAEEEEVIFDYKIHHGICEQSNAIKLLGCFGFPERIVEDANGYLRQYQDKGKTRG